MTHRTAEAQTIAGPSSPTTKSYCPEGAGLIDQPAAFEGSYTPPQACAAHPSCDVATLTPESQHAQPAEGYKHPSEHVTRLVQALFHACLTLTARTRYNANFYYFGHTQCANVWVTVPPERAVLWDESVFTSPFSHETAEEAEARATAELEQLGAKVYQLLKGEGA